MQSEAEIYHLPLSSQITDVITSLQSFSNDTLLLVNDEICSPKQNDRKQFTFQMYHKSVCGSHFLFL